MCKSFQLSFSFNLTIDYSIINRMSSPMKIALLLLVTVATLALEASQTYLSLPFTYAQTTTRTEHIINVQINRYPYAIDITIDNHPTFFLNLAQISARKQIIQRVDYRKHNDNIFGIIEFTPVEHADPKLDTRKRLAYNLYSYFKNIVPRLAWFNLQNVEQVPTKQHFSTLSEGTFNFGPSAADSPILKDLKRYCEYMREPVVSFSMQQEQGHLFFGSFPLSQLSNPLAHATVKLQNYQNQHWRILTQSVLLRQKNNRKNQEFYLVKEMVKFELTLSSKVIVLPKKCAAAFEKTVLGCRFVVEELSNQRLLTCSGLAYSKLRSMELEFSVAGSTIPLVFKFQQLIKYSDSEQTIFYISWGEQEILQVGQTLLRQYTIGINYREALLHYGKTKDSLQIDLFTVLRWVLIANLLLFIFSLLVVIVEPDLRTEVIERVKKQVEFYSPKSKQQSAVLSSSQTLAI